MEKSAQRGWAVLLGVDPKFAFGFRTVMKGWLHVPGPSLLQRAGGGRSSDHSWTTGDLGTITEDVNHPRTIAGYRGSLFAIPGNLGPRALRR